MADKGNRRAVSYRAWNEDMAALEKTGVSVPKNENGSYVPFSQLRRIKWDGERITKVLCLRCKEWKTPASFAAPRRSQKNKGYVSGLDYHTYCRACEADKSQRTYVRIKIERDELRAQNESLAARLDRLERELGMGDAE